jgi:Winged helix DNA-binding domain
MTSMTWTDVCARRLGRHFLAEPSGGDPADVAAAMCGAHAQVITAAELSIGLRLPGGTRADVRDALWVRRSLVKTRGPRGTVHLLPTSDLPMWMGALSALPVANNPYPDDVRLTPDQTEEVLAAMAAALPGFEPAPPEKALAEMLRRYLHAYGPATPAHFAQWLSAPRTWAISQFDGEKLERVEVEGTSAWVLTGDTAAPATGPQGVRLLPYFDAYVVGCHPRELLFPGRAAERALAGGQGGNYPVLLINGVVAGVWHLRRAGRKLDITVEPLGRLSAAHRRALHDQVARIGEFLEGTPKLTIGPVTVGGHA